MRIGILTFHAQINYGGVLQCFALHEALRKLGHEPVVIDRWFSEDNAALFPYVGKSLKCKVKTLARWFWGCGEVERRKRYVATQNFNRKYLNLTPYSFCTWKDAPKDLGLDAIVVGSDQVWNGAWQDPGAFLLEDAPEIPALSYAASFGMQEIPAPLAERYKQGFYRFSFISVREAEGKEFVEKLGAAATLVVDPSQLLSSRQWFESLGLSIPSHTQTSKKPNHIVCYFIKEDVTKAIPVLEAYAKSNHCIIDVLTQSFTPKHVPKNMLSLLERTISNLKTAQSPVQLRIAAGPREFIELFGNADVIISDSFHALMFASIFHSNIRVLKPHEEIRAKMFSRITEFASAYVNGEIVANDLTDALHSLSKAVSYRDDELSIERKKSLTWLRDKLQAIADTTH